MHLIVRDSASLDEIGEPQDLALDRADFILLSFSDSDLSVFRAGLKGACSAHFINLAVLRHPISVDLFIEKTVPGIKAILLRLLGGLDYWRYGSEELAHACRKHGVTLAVLPGDGRADAKLTSLSTLEESELDALDRVLFAGGPTNAAAAAKALISRADGCRIDVGPSELEVLPEQGVYREASGDAGEIAIVFYRSFLLAGDIKPIDALFDHLRDKTNEGAKPAIRAYYVPSLKAPTAANWLREQFKLHPPDVIVNTTAFSARGEDGCSVLDDAGCTVLQAAMASCSLEAWRASSRGLSPADLAMHVVLPEIDGRIFAGAISFKDRDELDAVFHRPYSPGLCHVARLASAWMRLRRMPRDARKLALVLSTYPGRPDQVAHAVGLDGPASALKIAQQLQAAGYAIPGLPSGARELLAPFLPADGKANPAIQRWSVPPDEVAPASAKPEDYMVPLTATKPEAITGDGSLNGNPSHMCWPVNAYEGAFAQLPDTLRDAVNTAWGPPENDPAFVSGSFFLPVCEYGNLIVALQPERGFLVDRKSGYHDPNIPPRHGYIAFYLWLRDCARVDALIHLGAHGTLEWLPGKAAALSEACAPQSLLGPVPVIYPFIVNDPGEAAQAKRRISALTIGHNTPPLIETDSSPALREIERLLDEYSAADGLDKKRRDRLAGDVLGAVAKGGFEKACGIKPEMTPSDVLARVDAFLCDVKELAIRDGLHTLDGSELRAILKALDGQFIAPGPSGAPSRGRADVLPTGRNLYSVDPRTIPTPLACENGARMADAIIARYVEDHGDWPRSMVLDLWGSQTMRTGGEEFGTALALLGVKPSWDYESFRVTGFEIVPLMKLNRPRVDVTLRISGLLRDMFPAQLAFFHAAVQRVAARTEEGSDNRLSRERGEIYRIFGAASGGYGAGITRELDTGDWKTNRDLGESYIQASGTAYSGEGNGVAARASLEHRIKSADCFIHVQDHRETDILSSPDFAAHEGGFAAAAAALGNERAAVYHGDAAAPESPRVRTLGEEAARVLHGRALSGRWIEGQMRHGFRGAAEIASTVDTAFAFAATSDAISSDGLEHLYDAYLGDPAVASFLARENGAALKAIQGRFKEAMARSLWKPRRNDLSALEGIASS